MGLSDNLKLVLPNQLFFLKDKEQLIYFDNIFLKEKHKTLQTIFSQANLGQTWGDVFVATPSVTSEGKISIGFVDDNMNVKSQEISYKCIDKSLLSGRTINTHSVGDSFTDMATWVNEVYQQLTDNGVTVNLMGTQGDNTNAHEALSGGTMDRYLLRNAGPAVIVNVTGITDKPKTGYYGTPYYDSNGIKWQVLGYKLDEEGNGKLKLGIFKYAVTDEYEESSNFPIAGTLTIDETRPYGDAVINYTDATVCYYNPYWNPSTKKLDFRYYIETWGYNPIDLFIIQFTWNDIPAWADDVIIQQNVERVKTIIDQLHIDYPSAKAIFSIEPMGALNPGNIDVDGKLYGGLKFTQGLFSKFENDDSYNTWFRISPSYMGVDRVNGYPTISKKLCSRYDIETLVAKDIVHCNEQGMRQIGDVIVPVIYGLY